MLHTLLYVSYSTLYMPDDEKVVQDILVHARRRNAQLGLTGALVFTHQRFAQYLEGPEESIAELMASIRRDSRHRDIFLIESGQSDRRRFAIWDMAYAGPSDLIAAHVDNLVAGELDSNDPLRAERMIRIMSFLAQHGESREAA